MVSQLIDWLVDLLVGWMNETRWNDMKRNELNRHNKQKRARKKKQERKNGTIIDYTMEHSSMNIGSWKRSNRIRTFVWTLWYSHFLCAMHYGLWTVPSYLYWVERCLWTCPGWYARNASTKIQRTTLITASKGGVKQLVRTAQLVVTCVASTSCKYVVIACCHVRPYFVRS